RPLILVVSFRYTTPRFTADGKGMKALSWAARDWNFAGVLRYQSAELIRTPASNNSLMTQLARDRTNNPATWGGGATFWNRVPGVSPLLFDPNCKCFDPTTQLVLNPAAWTDAPAGQFGTSAAYYNNFRWQRQPAESLSFGRTFRLFREGTNLNIRAEFQNVFNRLYLANPALVNITGFNPTPSNPSTPTLCAGGCFDASGARNSN